MRSVRPGTVAFLSGARSTVRSIDGETIRPWEEIDVSPARSMMSFNSSSVLNLGGGLALVDTTGLGPTSAKKRLCCSGTIRRRRTGGPLEMCAHWRSPRPDEL